MRVCNVLDLKIERQLLHDAFRKHLKVDSSVIRQEFQMVNHGNVRKLLGRRVAVANQYILLIWKVRLSAAHNLDACPLLPLCMRLPEVLFSDRRLSGAQLQPFAHVSFTLGKLR